MKVNTYVTMDVEIALALKEYCKVKGIPISKVVSAALRAYLGIVDQERTTKAADLARAGYTPEQIKEMLG